MGFDSEKNILCLVDLFPMLNSLDTVALRRKALELTQAQLAKLAGVSQSYIAKLEAKTIEPSYTKVQAIFEALEELEKGRETKVGEIMTADVVSVQTGERIQVVVSLMRKHGFSQFPVFAGNKSVGSVTERSIIDRMVSSDGDIVVGNRAVSEVMEDPFPQVGEDAPISLIANLLRVYPAVLVHRKDKITGIVTKVDLLKVLV